MGVSIINKDVNVISSILNRPKASISTVFGIGGWAGGGPASQGPLVGSTAVNDTSIGDVSWTNPTNIFNTGSPSSGAQIVLYEFQISNYIKATNFGFSIPTGATINGIIVNITRIQDDFYIKDYRVRIVKGGVIGTTDRSKTTFWDTGLGENVTYGSSTDLWGESWTAADINSSGFGFAISGYDTFLTKFPWNGWLSELKITVYYTI